MEKAGEMEPKNQVHSSPAFSCGGSGLHMRSKKYPANTINAIGIEKFNT
ncbi:hypothetical protein [Neobacillus drentensis]|nr:hypothetical protein [Neobacillus drentensis]